MMRLADTLLDLPPDRLGTTAWIDRNPDSSLRRCWTWHEITALTASTASFLQDHFVRPGDRVVNIGSNSLAWAILDVACSAINAVHVPIDPRFSMLEQANCIEIVNPTLIFSDTASFRSDLELAQLISLPQTKRLLNQLAVPFDPNDVANILFTSGTTGNHRGVMLSHRNLISNANAKLDAMPQMHQDLRLNFLPFAHAYARTCELTTWLISQSCMEVASGINDVLRIASISEPTLINGVPVFYKRLATEWSRFGSSRSSLSEILGTRIRRLASGGASLSDELRTRFAKVELPIFQGYGLTESSPVVCSNRSASDLEQRDDLIEVGPPVKGMKVRIDENSRLWVSGEGVMLGYWDNPEASRAKMVGAWLDTGDVAEYADDSSPNCGERSVRILGRADDTIVLSTGYKIQPLPIEQIIEAQPWVSQCLLLGTNHPFPIILLKLAAAEKNSIASEERFVEIQRLLSAFPRHAIPRKLILVAKNWSAENGLANFKGGLIRNRIEKQLRDEIEEAYRS